MVMMLTIAVSANGNNNIHRGRKCPAAVERKICADHNRHCRCTCHQKSWRGTTNKPCKKCQKQMKKMKKQYEKNMKNMKRPHRPMRY